MNIVDKTRGWEGDTRLGRLQNRRFIDDPSQSPRGTGSWTRTGNELDMSILRMDMSTLRMVMSNLVWTFTRRGILSWEYPGGRGVW